MQLAKVNVRSLVPATVFQEVATHLRKLLSASDCPSALHDRVLAHLSGKGRLLPEGGFSPWPFLTLMVYQTITGQVPSAAVPGAAAIEVLVACADLIDDVQDGEFVPSDTHSISDVLEVVWVLQFLAQESLVQSGGCMIPDRRVSDAGLRLSRLAIRAMNGQHCDIASNGSVGVRIRESLETSLLKSASLTRCAAEVGAALATDDAQVISAFGDFGVHLGMVGQLMNDIAAVWPGGPKKSDLRLGKMTPPIVAGVEAGRRGNPDGVMVARFIERVSSVGSDEITDVDVEQAKWALWRSGAIQEAWTAAAIERAAGQRCARDLANSIPAAADLVHLID